MPIDPIIAPLVNPTKPFAQVPIMDLPVEILRDHLLRAMLAAHLAQRAILPMERLPVVPKDGSRLMAPTTTLELLGSWLGDHLNLPFGPTAIGRYGALLVYAITLWRTWRQQHLPCSPGFALLAPRVLFLHQDVEAQEQRRTFRVQLTPAGCRPLRERWESAPAKAYREPITHAEVLDGLSFIVENELLPLKWQHVLPWITLDVVRPLSAQAATERRAPRLWLFPLNYGKLEFDHFQPQDGRPWTGGFRMNFTKPMTENYRDALTEELWNIATLVATHQERGPSRDILVFPELCLDSEGVRELRKALQTKGAHPALVIAGSHHAALSGDARLALALAPVFVAGEDDPLWSHQKRGPFRVLGQSWKEKYPNHQPPLKDDDELWEQVIPGDTFTTFDGPGGRLGVLICADLLEERFPAMRDLVRISHVDLLIVVNYSQKTTLFMRHAEQLNRIGVCAVFLNAADALPNSTSCRSPTECEPIDPFSALVAMPELALSRQTPKLPTWFTWRSVDRRIEARDKRKWVNVEASGRVAEYGDPAALFVDLNEWLEDPAIAATIHNPVMTALGPAINRALTGHDSPREIRVASLLAVEQSALPHIANSLPAPAKKLLHQLAGPTSGLFEPTLAEHGETLYTLFTLSLARPHRLAVPPKPGQLKGSSAESHFIVSLTPLGEALALTLPAPKRAPRSTRLGA